MRRETEGSGTQRPYDVLFQTALKSKAHRRPVTFDFGAPGDRGPVVKEDCLRFRSSLVCIKQRNPSPSCSQCKMLVHVACEAVWIVFLHAGSFPVTKFFASETPKAQHPNPTRALDVLKS